MAGLAVLLAACSCMLACASPAARFLSPAAATVEEAEATGNSSLAVELSPGDDKPPPCEGRCLSPCFCAEDGTCECSEEPLAGKAAEAAAIVSAANSQNPVGQEAGSVAIALWGSDAPPLESSRCHSCHKGGCACLGGTTCVCGVEASEDALLAVNQSSVDVPGANASAPAAAATTAVKADAVETLGDSEGSMDQKTTGDMGNTSKLWTVVDFRPDIANLSEPVLGCSHCKCPCHNGVCWCPR